MNSKQSINLWYLCGMSLCNFDCAYCASGVPERGGARTRTREWITPEGLSRFNQILEWIPRQPYQIGVRLQTVGEPLVSRDFLRGAARLSNEDNICFVELVTNGSLLRQRVPRLIGEFGADPTGLCLWVTQHFGEISTAELIDQVCYARDQGIGVVMNALLFPDNLAAVEETVRVCQQQGLELNIDLGQNFNNAYTALPFFPVLGDPNRSRLPQLGIDARALQATLVAASAPRGLPCSAGHDYVHILMNGDVYPCRTYRSLGAPAKLGSALDSDFVLRLREQEYAPCEAARACICKEDFLHLQYAREPQRAANRSLGIGYSGIADPAVDAEVAARLTRPGTQ
ncbi:MAG: MoaA/NifB/PqqE/SkfB family radical SAM enzyme [Gammaproteobacteria bacterium]|jgi:MoaA/NifB/PqqE/SkfB family radical SAM enzyme